LRGHQRSSGFICAGLAGLFFVLLSASPDGAAAASDTPCVSLRFVRNGFTVRTARPGEDRIALSRRWPDGRPVLQGLRHLRVLPALQGRQSDPSLPVVPPSILTVTAPQGHAP
jgi:hypothetical protein